MMISVDPYDHSWARSYQLIRKRVRGAFGDIALAIEHVGSTAVPGLAAKPIIDVDVLVARGRLREAIRLLDEIGYQHEGDLGIPGREAFRSRDPSPAHHLYVCIAGTPEWERHLRFRDELRADPSLAAAYAELKRTLAARHAGDRDAYTVAKSRFVAHVLGERRTS